MPYRSSVHFRFSVLLVILFRFFSGSPPTVAESAESGPYRLTPFRETAAVTALLALSLSGSITAAPDPNPLPLDRENVPAPDRIALGLHSGPAGVWSDRTRLACTVLPLLAAAGAFRTGDKSSLTESLTVLAMYAESSALTHGLTTLAKNSFRRSRPYAYDPALPVGVRSQRDASRSLWSGHSAIAFNGAVFAGTVFQAYRPESRLVAPLWAAGLALATTTAVLRVRAGQHFPSDVLAGAAVGSFTGWLIPRLHRKDPGTLRFFPTVSGAPGLGVNWKF